MIYNGHDFSSLLIEEKVHQGIIPPMQNTVVDVPGQHGARFMRSKLGSRELTVELRYIGQSRRQAKEVAGELAAMLHSEAPSRLALDLIPGREYLAIIDGSPEWETFLHTARLSITFVAHDPIAYGERLIYKLGENGVIDVPGTWATKPTIEVTTEAASYVLVKDHRTGNTMRFEGNFQDGQKLVIDCEKRFATLDGENAMPLMSIMSDWLELVPGKHTMSVEGGSAMKVVLDERMI